MKRACLTVSGEPIRPTPSGEYNRRLEAERDALRAQRDELAAALQWIAGTPDCDDAARARARAALAKVQP